MILSSELLITSSSSSVIIRPTWPCWSIIHLDRVLDYDRHLYSESLPCSLIPDTRHTRIRYTIVVTIHIQQASQKPCFFAFCFFLSSLAIAALILKMEHPDQDSTPPAANQVICRHSASGGPNKLFSSFLLDEGNMSASIRILRLQHVSPRMQDSSHCSTPHSNNT